MHEYVDVWRDLPQYMLHCHMLEPEDDGMMTQFEVVRANPTPRPRPIPRPRPTAD
jgi:Multicopper oxidase